MALSTNHARMARYREQGLLSLVPMLSGVFLYCLGLDYINLSTLLNTWKDISHRHRRDFQ